MQIIADMKKILIALIMPTVALANSDQCVLQDRTVTQQSVTVAERADIRAEVVPAFGNSLVQILRTSNNLRDDLSELKK